MSANATGTTVTRKTDRVYNIPCDSCTRPGFPVLYRIEALGTHTYFWLCPACAAALREALTREVGA